MVYFTNQLRGREKEKGIKTKKRVKLAAKMLMIAWSLMKKKEYFDPRYLTSQAEQEISRKPIDSGNGGDLGSGRMEIVACRANTEVVFGPSTRKTGFNMKFTLVWYPKAGP